jgi:hypothetical protein
MAPAGISMTATSALLLAALPCAPALNWRHGAAANNNEIARQQKVNTNRDRRQEFLIMFLIDSSGIFDFYYRALDNSKAWTSPLSSPGCTNKMSADRSVTLSSCEETIETAELSQHFRCLIVSPFIQAEDTERSDDQLQVITVLQNPGKRATTLAVDRFGCFAHHRGHTSQLECPR